jgi:uncharacterized protein involved in exopolysaccharide biosynthesis
MPTNSGQAPADENTPASPDNHSSAPSERKRSSIVVITVIAVILGLILAGLLWPFGQTKIYQATAVLRFHGTDTITTMPDHTLVSSHLVGPEEVNTFLATFYSKSALDNVTARLTGADLRQFMAPYKTSGASTRPLSDILSENLKVAQQRGNFLINVQYRHPDPLVAAKVANLFAEESIALNAQASRVESATTTILDRAVPPSPDAFLPPVNGFRRLIQWFKR